MDDRRDGPLHGVNVLDRTWPQRGLVIGGTVERESFSDVADIAVCADPFGNGFCLIRE